MTAPSQLTFEQALGEDTQCAKILRALHAARGGWVSVWDLHKASNALAVHSRIDDLRHDFGFFIENKTERVGRVKHSWYRLVL